MKYTVLVIGLLLANNTVAGPRTVVTADQLTGDPQKLIDEGFIAEVPEEENSSAPAPEPPAPEPPAPVLTAKQKKAAADLAKLRAAQAEVNADQADQAAGEAPDPATGEADPAAATNAPGLNPEDILNK